VSAGLNVILSASFTKEEIPGVWERANVAPIFKRGNGLK